MKTLDVVFAALLVVGGLSWGLVGLFKFDLVATVLGPMSGVGRFVYALVGLAALYQAISMNAIQRRWGLAATIGHSD